jgi:hypothetical protein
MSPPPPDPDSVKFLAPIFGVMLSNGTTVSTATVMSTGTGGKLTNHADRYGTRNEIPEMQCCGSRMFIPDPNFFHPGSRVKKILGSPDPDPHQRI